MRVYEHFTRHGVCHACGDFANDAALVEPCNRLELSSCECREVTKAALPASDSANCSHQVAEFAEARSPRPTPPVPTHSVSEVGCPLVGLGRKLFEAEAGFAFQAPRQLTAVQSSEAGLQPDERMLDLRFRFLDRNAFSPAVSPNRSKHGCQMQRL